jgi:hypothetical protein
VLAQRHAIATARSHAAAFELRLDREDHLKCWRCDRIHEQLADCIVKGAARDLLAHGLSALDAPGVGWHFGVRRLIV